MNGQAIGIGIAALVAAEATGITNLSGSGGGGSVNVSMPQKGPNAPIPTPGGDSGPSMESIAAIMATQDSGPSIQEIAAVTQDSGPSEAMLAALAASGNQPAQIVQRGKDAVSPEQIKQYIDANLPDGSGNSGGSTDSTSTKESSTVGGDLGHSTAEFVWHATGGKGLAQALDANAPGFSGNLEDNTNNILNTVGETFTGPRDVKNTYTEETKKSADELADLAGGVFGTLKKVNKDYNDRARQNRKNLKKNADKANDPVQKSGIISDDWTSTDDALGGSIRDKVGGLL